MIYRAVRGQATYGQPLGIIMMDTFIPFPPGTPGNATTFDHPVLYRLVGGASMQRVVYEPDPALAEEMLAAGRELVASGVRAVMGNCGFMIQYQALLAAELPVPVAMSSLLQLPLVARMLRPGEKVGILTASKRSLDRRLLTLATGGVEVAVRIADMQAKPNFNAAVNVERGTLDFAALERETVEAASELVAADPAVRALVFECTDLPPYAAAVQQATGLPVFDWTTLAGHLVGAVVRQRFSGYV